MNDELYLEAAKGFGTCSICGSPMGWDDAYYWGGGNIELPLAHGSCEDHRRSRIDGKKREIKRLQRELESLEGNDNT